MVKVKFNETASGPDVLYAAGQEYDVDADYAARLIAAGQAVEATPGDDNDAEPTKRARGRPRKDAGAVAGIATAEAGPVEDDED